MDINQLFSDEVRKELDLLDVHLSAQRRQSLPDLLQAWGTYGRLLAEGRHVNLDDYLAILFTRDAIQYLLQRAAPAVSRLLKAMVCTGDDLFLFGTKRDDTNILQSKVTEVQNAWWWKRIPFDLSSDSIGT